MDPVTEIVTALSAGAASSLQDGTKDAVKAAYARLYELVKNRFSGHPSAEAALAGHQSAPQADKAPLADKLAEFGAAHDSQVMKAARELLLLLNEAGALGTRAHDFQGGQFGDGNFMLNIFPGHNPYRPDAAGGARAAHPVFPATEELMSEPRVGPAWASLGPGRRWSPAFSNALAYSLGEFPPMEYAEFRDLFLRHVGEQLGVPLALRMSAHDDARHHIFAIVSACHAHKDPVAAVRALHDVMAELCPGTAGLRLLEDCYWAVAELTALSLERLHAVLGLIRPLARERDTMSIQVIVNEVALEDESPQMRGMDDLDLVSVVRRLNVAPVSTVTPVPLVVRFLDKLASRTGGMAGSRLKAEVGEILRELGVASDGLGGERPMPDEPAGSQPAVASDHAVRILQIRVEEASSPENPRYEIDATVFSMKSGSRQRLLWWECEEKCSLDDMEDVGGRFLAQSAGLARSLGEARDLMVEFLLPWSLLGHPVERWRLDEDGFWIGHRFPVVVRSLDRQRKESFYQSWRHRWELLSGENAGRPVGGRLGWLHHGNGAVPEVADLTGRVIHLTGRNALTQWLEKEENQAIAGLGLTFAYQPDDPAAMNGMKAAMHEGIPLLVWLRGKSDVSQLERLLEHVNIRDLPGKVYKWRRETSDFDETTRDARYHVVLLWDDPNGAVRPSERRFAAPR